MENNKNDLYVDLIANIASPKSDLVYLAEKLTQEDNDTSSLNFKFLQQNFENDLRLALKHTLSSEFSDMFDFSIWNDAADSFCISDPQFISILLEESVKKEGNQISKELSDFLVDKDKHADYVIDHLIKNSDFSNSNFKSKALGEYLYLLKSHTNHSDFVESSKNKISDIKDEDVKQAFSDELKFSDVSASFRSNKFKV